MIVLKVTEQGVTLELEGVEAVQIADALDACADEYAKSWMGRSEYGRARLDQLRGMSAQVKGALAEKQRQSGEAGRRAGRA